MKKIILANVLLLAFLAVVAFKTFEKMEAQRVIISKQDTVISLQDELIEFQGENLALQQEIINLFD